MLRVSSEQHIAHQHTSCPLRAVMPFRERPRGLPVSLAVAVCLPFALNVYMNFSVSFWIEGIVHIVM